MSITSALSQPIGQGVPYIDSYTSIDYKQHPRNFSVAQDFNGMLYFGNAYGVMEYDGSNWRTIPLPDGKSALSLVRSLDGTIYVGSADKLGKLSKDSNGQLHYQSLLHKIPKSERNFGELTKVLTYEDKVVYVSLTKVIVFSDAGLKTLNPSKPGRVFEFAAIIDHKVVISESGVGLLSLDDEGLHIFSHGDYFKADLIYSMFTSTEQELIVLSTTGFHHFDGEVFTLVGCEMSDFLLNHKGTSGFDLGSGQYALSTVNGGLVIYNSSGEILRVINKQTGLLSNNVISVFKDKEKNLWLTSDRGLNHVHTSSGFSVINENQGLLGLGYAAYIHNEKLYLGTSQGLFSRPLHFNNENESNLFSMVSNANEQVWFLGVENGVLLLGDNRGLFEVNQSGVTKLSPGVYTGGWVFKRYGEYLVLGTYLGLEIYEFNNGHWVYRNKVKGFDKSSRVMEIDEFRNIWVCHGNEGLFKLKLDGELDSVVTIKNFNQAQGFANNYFNDITKVEKDLLFVGGKSIYVYDPFQDKLEAHQFLNELVKEDVLLTRIGYHGDGRIWLVNQETIELISKMEDGDYVKDNSRFQKIEGQLIGSFEYFWKATDENYFIGAQNGFIHYYQSEDKPTKDFQVAIRSIESITDIDSLLFNGTYLDIEDYSKSIESRLNDGIRFELNGLRFSCAAMFYEDRQSTEFQYALQKSDEEEKRWSHWSSASYKEYSNLWEGNYTFYVRAKNIFGTISETSIEFRVLPPWYRSLMAYFSYVISFIVVLVLVVYLVRKKINRERQRIADEKEKEIILLKNEKLITELSYKNDELATLATSLTHKNDFLTKLKRDLESVNGGATGNNHTVQINQLIKAIENDIKFDDSWDHFQTNFDRVYHDFLAKLRGFYPQLKPTDLLLCAYIKMNKSNKEIASLLNISDDAVKKRRVRLKGKLDIESDLKLAEYLLSV